MYNLAEMKNNIQKYISELLFLHDCVILLDFGGFVSNNKPSVLNKITGIITPPSKEILFNPNLKTNDGLLINHIAISEEITNEEAKDILQEYVVNIKEKIQKLKTYRIENVGLLTLSANGNILFIQDVFTNYNLNSFGLKPQTTKKIDIVEKTIEIIKEPSNSIEVGRKIWRAAAILLPIIGLALISITQENKIQNVYSQMANFSPFLYYENSLINNDLETENIKPLNNKLEAITVNENNIEIKEITKNIQKNYHLIAGAFKNKRNAENLVKKLQSENYNSSIIGITKNGLIRVSFDSYQTKKEAMMALENLKSENKSSWILSL